MYIYDNTLKMYTSIRLFLPLLMLVASGGICYAQSQKNAYEFTRGDKVIFEDDFSKDTVGAFPSKWHISLCNEFYAHDTSNRHLWRVETDSVDHTLLVMTNGSYLDPNIDSRFYLHDSFALETDFRFNTPNGGAEIVFYPYENPNPCLKERIQIWSSGQLRRDVSSGSRVDKVIGKYPTPFLKNTWHHFAFAYKKGAADFYIDETLVASLPDCGFAPYAVCIGSHNPVSYKHFRITTGANSYDFSKILSGSTLVTHAINFDVNKSVINAEGLAFLGQLAQFLRANPFLKLEIDGHTDSDGDADANMKLSQERADAVKRQLELVGIDGSRLIPVGYGLTKPKVPNATPEGKAENRRVEFVKQ
jgi:outer membrane protein OmpA-like peptidoglycan-associated protein